MALELIGALVAAATLGLLFWALRRRFASLPKWSVPGAAAVGLIGTTLWLEYTWFDRVSAQLPLGIEVVKVEEEAMPLRPWTYVKPIKMRFWALDRSKVFVHPTVSELKLVTLFKFARWRPVEEGLLAVNCSKGLRVPVVEGVEITDDGTLKGAEWEVAADGDTLQEAACREG